MIAYAYTKNGNWCISRHTCWRTEPTNGSADVLDRMKPNKETFLLLHALGSVVSNFLWRLRQLKTCTTRSIVYLTTRDQANQQLTIFRSVWPHTSKDLSSTITLRFGDSFHAPETSPTSPSVHHPTRKFSIPMYFSENYSFNRDTKTSLFERTLMEK